MRGNANLRHFEKTSRSARERRTRETLERDVRERQRQRDRGTDRRRERVCVCVREREQHRGIAIGCLVVVGGAIDGDVALGVGLLRASVVDCLPVRIRKDVVRLSDFDELRKELPTELRRDLDTDRP